MDERSDAELLDLVRAQDSGAFRVLFQRYYPRVFAFVHRRLGDAGLSEEAVADTFFEVWRGAEGFRGESRISTWIFGIATFKCMEADRNRRRRKRSAVVPTNLEVLHQVADETPLEGSIEARDELRWLKIQIESLPQSQRQVLEMALLEGRDYEEIAQRLRVSRGTVKSRLSRARRDLRRRANHSAREVGS